jgi:hypothetical protein
MNPLGEKDETLRSIIASTVSEARILEIERDIKSTRERLSALETERKNRSVREQRSFTLKMTIITAGAALAGSALTYLLTKLGLIH